MDNETPDMDGLEKFHAGHLPVWSEGNVYLAGASAWKKERDSRTDEKSQVQIELEEKDGHMILKTNLYDLVKAFRVGMISSDTLGRAFEPEERFENPDGTDIVFDSDYLGAHRGLKVLPGPFAEVGDEMIVY